VGDEVLVTLARRVQAVTRDTDLLVRWGGEEFLLVARLDAPERGVQIAERLLQAVNGRPFETGAGAALPVSCTLGLVELPFVDGGEDPPWTALVALADLALYEGKAQGRNRWVAVENAGIADAAGLAAVLQRPLSESVAAGRVRLRSGA
jgi:diguanylate cyclase (GGDEF)-like protein